MVERTRTKSTRVTKFLKKLAKESIPRFVSQEEAAVAPQKFKSRRQSLPQPVAGFELAIHSGRPDLNRLRKPRPTKTRGWQDVGPLRDGVLCLSLGRTCRHRPPITWDGAYGRDPTSATARVSPSPMIKPVPASIRARVGNKLGTVLATSAPCGHNAKTPRWRRASLGFADFKHHRNLFPMRRRWQTRRTQNPVLARGCGFKSHLRY
jgi:hypothetical protein